MNGLLLAVNMPLIIGIVIGAVALIAVLAIVFFFMRKKRRGTDGDRNKEDRDLIAANAASVEALLVLAENNAELIAELKELQEKIKYLMPSVKDDVFELDKKITNLIGDLRIALTKTDGEEDKKTENLIKQIKLTIADRGVKQQ